MHTGFLVSALFQYIREWPARSHHVCARITAATAPPHCKNVVSSLFAVRCRRRCSLDTGFTPRAAVSARRSPRWPRLCPPPLLGGPPSRRGLLSQLMIPHFLPAWQDEWHCPGERQTATSPWCMGSGHTSRAARMCSLHTNVHVLEAATAIPRRNIDTGPRIQDSGSRILLISACPWPPAGPPRSPGAWILASLHVGMYAGASVRRVQTIADEPQLPVGQTLRYVGGGSAASDMDRTRSFPTSWRQIVFDTSAHCTCCICCSLLLFRRIMCHWLIAQRPTHSLFQRPLPKYMGPRT